MLAGYDQEDLLGEQVVGRHPAGSPGSHHPAVQLAADDRFLELGVVLLDEVDAHARVGGDERRQQRDEYVRHDHGDGTEMHGARPSPRLLADDADGVFGAGDDGDGQRQQQFAGHRELHVTAVADEQPRVQHLFQPGDLPADGRLGGVEGLAQLC